MKCTSVNDLILHRKSSNSDDSGFFGNAAIRNPVLLCSLAVVAAAAIIAPRTLRRALRFLLTGRARDPDSDGEAQSITDAKDRDTAPEPRADGIGDSHGTEESGSWSSNDAGEEARSTEESSSPVRGGENSSSYKKALERSPRSTLMDPDDDDGTAEEEEEVPPSVYH